MNKENVIYSYNTILLSIEEGFPGGSDGKESACNVGDLGLIPGLGRSLGEGPGNPRQYFCLENPMEREAWWATVLRAAKSHITDWLSHTHTAAERNKAVTQTTT